MSGPEEFLTHNTMHGNVYGNAVQSGSMRDVHVHSSPSPAHRDPRLVPSAVVALVAGLAGLVLVLLLCVSDLLQLFLGGPPWRSVLALPLFGFLTVNLLWTGWDLMGRRHHAWRQDAFAGQSSLWLVLLAWGLFDTRPPTVTYFLQLAPFGTLAAATVAAVVLTCKGGARRRWGPVVMVGMGAALWFGLALWVFWASGVPLPKQVAATLVLAVGMAVPVLAATAMPVACGGVVLRGWALGVGLTPVWVVMSSQSRPSPVFDLTACVVVVVLAVVASGLLNRGEKPTAAVGGSGSAADPR